MRVNVLILNTELWALKLRLAYEYEFYDHFIVVESSQTFSGIRKPLYTKEYRNKIPDPDSKIRYVYLSTLPWEPEVEYLSSKNKIVRGNRWPAEVASRNAATIPLINLVHDAHDIIVVQDADEIANLNSVIQAERELGLLGLHHLSYADYRGSVAKQDKREAIWTGGYVIRASMLGLDLHDLRRVNRRSDGTLVYWHVVGPHICSKLDGSPMYPQRALPRFFDYAKQAENPTSARGWHLTNMCGGFEALFTNKLSSYAHAENDQNNSLPCALSESTGDLWEAFNRFAATRDYSSFKPDPELPRWIAERLDGYPILKRV